MLENKKLKELSVLNPYRFTFDMLMNWVIVIGCMIVFSLTQNWWLYLPLIFIVATRQQAMGILVHDIAHNRYLKKTALADLIGNFLMGYPLLLSVEAYRSHHLKHHRHINTEQDPDWNYKMGKEQYSSAVTKKRLAIHLFKTTIGFGVAEMAMYMTKVVHKKEKSSESALIKGAYYVLALAGMIYFDLWKVYLLMWLVPQLTFLMGLLELRSFTEHVGLEADALPARTIKANFVEGFMFNPHNAHYHLEHHLYPSVPYYNLPLLHNELMKSDEFSQNTKIAHGYFSEKGTIAQLVNAGPDMRLVR